MAPPTAHDIAVATAALRDEAEVWSTQAGVLATTAEAAGRLAFDRLQAGIFQLVVSAHTDLATTVTDRCRGGATEARRIAATLHRVADTYDDEERRRVHALRNLY